MGLLKPQNLDAAKKYLVAWTDADGNPERNEDGSYRMFMPTQNRIDWFLFENPDSEIDCQTVSTDAKYMAARCTVKIRRKSELTGSVIEQSFSANVRRMRFDDESVAAATSKTENNAIREVLVRYLGYSLKEESLGLSLEEGDLPKKIATRPGAAVAPKK